MRLRLILAMALIASGSTPAAAKPPYLEGKWGGEHAAIGFNTGLADIMFDCASGSIDTAVVPAKDGSFAVEGTYREGSPGPVRVGQIFRSQPATYSGVVTKGAMTLNVELEDGTVVGPFNLTQGVPPQITRCR